MRFFWATLYKLNTEDVVRCWTFHLVTSTALVLQLGVIQVIHSGFLCSPNFSVWGESRLCRFGWTIDQQ